MWGCADVIPQGEWHCLGQVSASVNSGCAKRKNKVISCLLKRNLVKLSFCSFIPVLYLQG